MNIKQNMDPGNLLTIREAAEYLYVAQSTLRKWKMKGLINPVRTQGGTAGTVRKT